MNTRICRLLPFLFSITDVCTLDGNVHVSKAGMNTAAGINIPSQTGNSIRHIDGISLSCKPVSNTFLETSVTDYIVEHLPSIFKDRVIMRLTYYHLPHSADVTV